MMFQERRCSLHMHINQYSAWLSPTDIGVRDVKMFFAFAAAFLCRIYYRTPLNHSHDTHFRCLKEHSFVEFKARTYRSKLSFFVRNFTEWNSLPDNIVQGTVSTEGLEMTHLSPGRPAPEYHQPGIATRPAAESRTGARLRRLCTPSVHYLRHVIADHWMQWTSPHVRLVFSLTLVKFQVMTVFLILVLQCQVLFAVRPLYNCYLFSAVIWSLWITELVLSFQTVDSWVPYVPVFMLLTR